MRSSFTPFFAAAAVALLASAFAAQPVRAQTRPTPLRSLEDAIESHTDKVLLPTTQPGTLTFRNCAEPCNLRSLMVTAESKFFVGGTQVTLADFNAYIQRTGPQFLMVFHQPARTDITRLIVYGRVQ